MERSNTRAFSQASPSWRKRVIRLFKYYLQQNLTTHHDLEPWPYFLGCEYQIFWKPISTDVLSHFSNGRTTSNYDSYTCSVTDYLAQRI